MDVAAAGGRKFSSVQISKAFTPVLYTMRRPCSATSTVQPINVGFPATNFRETINGYQYGTTPGPTMRQGKRVRWYTAGMAGPHTGRWHANTVMLDRRMGDVVPALPAEMHTTDMIVRSPGTWMIHCHVEGHLAGGMYGHYTVEPRPKPITTTRPR